MRPLVEMATELEVEPLRRRSVPFYSHITIPRLREVLPIRALLTAAVAVRGKPDDILGMLPEKDPFPEVAFSVVPITDETIERAKVECPAFMVHVLKRAPLGEGPLTDFLSRLSPSSIEAIVQGASRFMGEGGDRHRWLVNVSDKHNMVGAVLSRRLLALSAIVANRTYGTRELYRTAFTGMEWWRRGGATDIERRMFLVFAVDFVKRLPGYLTPLDVQGLLAIWPPHETDDPGEREEIHTFFRRKLACHKGVIDEQFARLYTHTKCLPGPGKGREALDHGGFEDRATSPRVVRELLRVGVDEERLWLTVERARRMHISWGDILRCLADNKHQVGTLVFARVLAEAGGVAGGHSLTAADLVGQLSRLSHSDIMHVAGKARVLGSDWGPIFKEISAHDDTATMVGACSDLLKEADHLTREDILPLMTSSRRELREMGLAALSRVVLPGPRSQ